MAFKPRTASGSLTADTATTAVNVAPGQTAYAAVAGDSFTAGAVRVELSFDKGATWALAALLTATNAAAPSQFYRNEVPAAARLRLRPTAAFSSAGTYILGASEPRA